jgi:hypothetical protein
LFAEPEQMGHEILNTKQKLFCIPIDNLKKFVNHEECFLLGLFSPHSQNSQKKLPEVFVGFNSCFQKAAFDYVQAQSVPQGDSSFSHWSFRKDSVKLSDEIDHRRPVLNKMGLFLHNVQHSHHYFEFVLIELGPRVALEG